MKTMQTIKILYISLIMFVIIINPLNPLSTIINIGPEEADAAAIKISDIDQSAITRIKNVQTKAESVVSVHVNQKKNGQTTVKMLEIPEHQLADIIEQWKRLGHEINRDTIYDEGFINHLVNNADIRSFSYTAKLPKLFFLVRDQIAEPMLFGGKIKKFFKTISFPGWLKIAGIIDEQGNYRKGYERLGCHKGEFVDLFKRVLSKTTKGSYTIVELYRDEDGIRKGRFRFFESSEQSKPTFEESIDTVAAFGLIYMNLIPHNPGDIGVKEDLTKSIVEKLVIESGEMNVLKKIVHLRQKNGNA